MRVLHIYRSRVNREGAKGINATSHKKLVASVDGLAIVLTWLGRVAHIVTVNKRSLQWPKARKRR